MSVLWSPCQLSRRLLVDWNGPGRPKTRNSGEETNSGTLQSLRITWQTSRTARCVKRRSRSWAICRVDPRLDQVTGWACKTPGQFGSKLLSRQSWDGEIVRWKMAWNWTESTSKQWNFKSRGCFDSVVGKLYAENTHKVGSITVRLTSCLFVWIPLLWLCCISISFICLVESKPVKQDVSLTVILPTMVSVLCSMQAKWTGQTCFLVSGNQASKFQRASWTMDERMTPSHRGRVLSARRTSGGRLPSCKCHSVEAASRHGMDAHSKCSEIKI